MEPLEYSAHGPQAMYHVAPTEARRSIERHGLDWRRLGLGGAYRPLGIYLWDSLDMAPATSARVDDDRAPGNAERGRRPR